MPSKFHKNATYVPIFARNKRIGFWLPSAVVWISLIRDQNWRLIVDARQKFTSADNSFQGKTEEYGKIFIGEPYEVDCEAAQASGAEAGYLALIEAGKAELEG